MGRPLTRHCAGLPNARFLGGSAPAKMPLVEVCLAGPASGGEKGLTKGLFGPKLDCR